MNILRAVVIGLGIGLTAPAAAETPINMTRLTCGELLSNSIEEYVVIGAWLSGYYHAKRGEEAIDPKTLAANSQAVSKYCRENSSVTVMKAIEQLSTKK